VIDTLTVADTQPPEGQSEGPPSGQAEGQDQGQSEGTAVKNDADQTKDGRLPWYRVVAAAVLLLAAIGFVLWLFVRPPDSFPVAASLVVAAAVAFGAGAVCLPSGLRKRLGTFAFVAGTSAAIVAAVLAIPTRPSPAPGSGETSGSESQSSSSPSPSPSPGETDPLTTNLHLGLRYSCEGFILKNSLLKSIPKGDEFTAEWVYKNGGATLPKTHVLTIEGKSESAVILEALRVVEFKKEPAPANVSVVLPCGPAGGGQNVRYFDVLLDKRPRVIPRPAIDPDEDGKIQPAVKFPYKVSRSDPESFELWVTGPPCVCSWKLALDWTSGGRRGTTLIKREFGSSIRTNTSYINRTGMPFYSRNDDGTWDPPLPK
jgi:hypothetical protein